MNAASSSLRPDSVRFSSKSFAELATSELYEILRLRAEAFVVEQQCAFQDVDGRDYDAEHLMAVGASGRLDGYARWFPVEDGTHLGRIVTSARVRGQGLGRMLVQEALERIGPRTVSIESQAHLEHFYCGFGFEVVGETYILDGIPHVPMRRSPRSASSNDRSGAFTNS